MTSILKRRVWIRKKYNMFVVSCALQIGVDVEECKESGTSKCYKVSNSRHRSREPLRIGQKYKKGVQKSLKMKLLFKKYVVGVVPKSSSSYVSGVSVCIFVALYHCNFVSLFVRMFVARANIRLKVL